MLNLAFKYEQLVNAQTYTLTSQLKNTLNRKKLYEKNF